MRRADDVTLARMVAAGSEPAFGELVDRYGGSLRAYCQSIVRQPQDAEDALQCTLVRAHRALQTGSRPEKPKAWLYRIAHNESVSLIRKRRDEAPLPDQLPGAAESAQDSAETQAEVRSLLDDVSQLPDRQKTALVLRELCGLGYTDVGEVLGTDEAGARLLAFQARGSLKEASAGRELPCVVVRDAYNSGGGRAMRARSLRSHLRACDACASYVSSGRTPRRGVAAWLPLPGLGWLTALLSGGGAGAAGGVSVASGVIGAKALGTALAVVGTVGVIEVAPRTLEHRGTGRPVATSRASAGPSSTTNAARPVKAVQPVKAAAVTATPSRTGTGVASASAGPQASANSHASGRARRAARHEADLARASAQEDLDDVRTATRKPDTHSDSPGPTSRRHPLQRTIQERPPQQQVQPDAMAARAAGGDRPRRDASQPFSSAEGPPPPSQATQQVAPTQPVQAAPEEQAPPPRAARR